MYKLPPPSHLLIRRYHRRTGRLIFPAIKYLTIPCDAATPKPCLAFLESDKHKNGIRISQSCNGLLLCPTDFAYTSNDDVKYYVYNQTTNESRLIPLPCYETEDSVAVAVTVTAMNLAFDPSISQHYKVVSLSVVNMTYFSYTRVDVYSSETGRWRASKAEFPRDCDRLDFSNGVFLNGAIHWASYRGETSYYFDVENECFKIMPMPPPEDGETRIIRFFGETARRLFLVHFHDASTMKFDVFMLEHDYSKWTVKHHVDFSRRHVYMSDLKHNSWSDHVHHFRRRLIVFNKFHILSMICGRDEDDLSMVIYMPGRDRKGKGLMIYNLRKKELKRVHSPVPSWDLRLLEVNGFYVVHPLFSTRFAV